MSFLENGVAEEADWRMAIRDMLITLTSEYELPKGSLYLSDNYGQTEKTRDKIVSHSVCIWEPNYPPVKNEKPGQNKLVMTIVPSSVKSRPDDLDITVRVAQEKAIRPYLPEDAEVLESSKSRDDLGTTKVRIKKHSSNLVEYIRRNTIYCIEGYISKADRFGCCSSFEECSNVKKCIHDNKLYSKACMYRENLEQGRIFFGKNRNID